MGLGTCFATLFFPFMHCLTITSKTNANVMNGFLTKSFIVLDLKSCLQPIKHAYNKYCRRTLAITHVIIAQRLTKFEKAIKKDLIIRKLK